MSSLATSPDSLAPRSGIALIEIAPKRVRRRRLERKIQWGVLWFGVVFFLVIAPIALAPFLKGGEIVTADPLRYYASVAPVVAVMALGAWFHTRRTILAVNRVAISADGFYPPFKPKQCLSKEDWFLPYKDIVSMTPAAERKGFVPAYNVTLRDGLTFQLNALDLLLYVGEKEVRRYAKILAIMRVEIETPENRARAARGEDIMIPKDRFDAVYS
ncbi:MAG TPA: hypothetical protein VEM77_02340 [Thermoplasmata archaeon]|nr:hypothetical protein [Thermoplasmata archaeon]